MTRVARRDAESAGLRWRENASQNLSFKRLAAAGGKPSCLVMREMDGETGGEEEGTRIVLPQMKSEQ
jgi:hypothetical protein